MTVKSAGVMLNDGGPWGGGESGDGGERGKRKPWQPKRPGAIGPSTIDQLLSRGRARFGGRPPSFEVGGMWPWAVLVVLVLWIGLTSVHTIGPQQRGVITRLGKYAGTLRPGLGLTFPAPFDLVTKIDVDNIHVVDIDSGPDTG